MQVLSLAVRDFRSYESASVRLGARITVVCGPNGAGKTNLLEAIYFGCTGYSCRTRNERELVRFGADTVRVMVRTVHDGDAYELGIGFAPGQPKRMSVDGACVERLLDAPQRPLVSVFLPDRLELIKGVPALRRAHLDRFVSALWPSRALTRRAYAQALAQRNALLTRLQGITGDIETLAAWDLQLARNGIALMEDRRRAVELIADQFGEIAATLGLDEQPTIAYRPRSRARDEAELAAELCERVQRDIERGFTTHGPHRDDLALTRAGRELRAFGSQGQQRIALLALLLAERDALGAMHGAAPLLLLDDVMSELDAQRRAALVELLRMRGGQVVITTTDLEHVPGVHDGAAARVEVRGGQIAGELLTA
ncbi:MAG: DNA replication/repair protein RecF [Solirubrobacteraceae bacterium]